MFRELSAKARKRCDPHAIKMLLSSAETIYRNLLFVRLAFVDQGGILVYVQDQGLSGPLHKHTVHVWVC